MILDEPSVQLLDAFLDACDSIRQRTAQFPPTDETDRRVKYRYYFYIEKSMSTFEAFTLLVRNGYLYEAQIVSRANFELMVDLLYYHTAPLQLSERFEDYFQIASECEGLLLSVCGDKALIPPSDQTRIQALKVSFCSKYDDKKFPKHWSGVDRFIDRAKTIGMERGYRAGYHLRSDIAHGGILSEASYIRFADTSLANAMNDLKQQTLHGEIGLACHEMLLCLRTIEDGLGLQIYELIHDLCIKCADYATAVGIPENPD